MHPELCIKLNYNPNNNKPAQIFEAISLYIQAYKELGQLMTNSIGIKENFDFKLNSIEVSSILSKLSTISKQIDSILEGIFYSAGNRTLIELAHDEKTESEDEVEKLAAVLESNLSEGLKNPLNDPHVDRQALAYVLQSLSIANQKVSRGETVEFDASNVANAKCNLNTNWRFTGNPREMFQGKTTHHNNTLLLQIKVSVNEGHAIWTFKSEKINQTFSARIIHNDWLERYQNGLIPLNPKDIIEAEVSYDVYEPPKGKGKPVIRNAKIVNVIDIKRFSGVQHDGF